MRYQGRITTWKDERGFGFITPDWGGQSVFAHIRAFEKSGRRPDVGDQVVFETEVDSQGRLQATTVRFKDRRLACKPRRSGSLPMRLVICFLAVMGTAVLMGWLPWLVLWAYLLASVLTFVVYAVDKSAAQREQWRTPEATLHLLALCCGWPGAAVAQQSLRHKTVKQPFQFVFWLTVLLNGAALAWFASPFGSAWLQSPFGPN